MYIIIYTCTARQRCPTTRIITDKWSTLFVKMCGDVCSCAFAWRPLCTIFSHWCRVLMIRTVDRVFECSFCKCHLTSGSVWVNGFLLIGDQWVRTPITKHVERGSWKHFAGLFLSRLLLLFRSRFLFVTWSDEMCPDILSHDGPFLSSSCQLTNLIRFGFSGSACLKMKYWRWSPSSFECLELVCYLILQHLTCLLITVGVVV